MKLSACHWGCTQGTVKFEEGEATLMSHKLKLTKEEITHLDSYFQMGKNTDEGWGCSLPIEISFVLKSRFKTVYVKETQIFPCSFGDHNKIDPLKLVDYFALNEVEDIPIWRLLKEERNGRLIIKNDD